jgi:hypothetical protein
VILMTKIVWQSKISRLYYLGVVFCISCMQCNLFQVQFTAEIHSWYNVPMMNQKCNLSF